MDPEEIESIIRNHIPDAKVRVENHRGDGLHFFAEVVSPSFEGLSRVKQHKMVYDALKKEMVADLHALSLQTSVPR
jgi:stress-induced morphogen